MESAQGFRVLPLAVVGGAPRRETESGLVFFISQLGYMDLSRTGEECPRHARMRFSTQLYPSCCAPGLTAEVDISIQKVPFVQWKSRLDRAGLEHDNCHDHLPLR